MKPYVFILAFLCPLSFMTLNAQKNSFFIGATGGVNLSKFKFTEDLSELYTTSNSVFGLNGGVSLGLEIQNFTLTTGARYMQKGGEYQTENFDENGATGFYTGREKLHFVSIPILLGYRKYLGDQIGFSFAMGPSINIGLSGKLDETTEYFGSEEVLVENYVSSFGAGVNDDYRSTQTSFQISPGLVFLLSDKSKLTFNITWDIGLGDSFNPRYKNANDFFAANKGNQMNRSTLFTLGYEYHFAFGDRY